MQGDHPSHPDVGHAKDKPANGGNDKPADTEDPLPNTHEPEEHGDIAPSQPNGGP